MKYSTSFIMVFCVISTFFFSCSEREISADQLQKRGELYYAVNEEDPYSGKVTELYENGQKKTESYYNDGLLDGLHIEWSDNGQKVEESHYEGGLLDGLHIKWYNNGQKDEESSYKDGILDGLFTKWEENGEKFSETTYRDGKKNGVFRRYVNGWKWIECSYEDDQYDGTYTDFYQNGKKRYEKTYKNGIIDGMFEEWLENGKKKTEKNYKDGECVEPWSYYNPDGQKIDLNFVENVFELKRSKNKDKPHSDIVSDKGTGLMWERIGSRRPVNYEGAINHVESLNETSFAGYNDWRLPTIEEAFSIFEPTKKILEKYFDPVFYAANRGRYSSPFVIWTVTKYRDKMWVFFYVESAWNSRGDAPGMSLRNTNEKIYAKAVRTL